MSDKPTNAEILRSQPWNIAGQALNVIFVVYIFAGSIFILFLDRLGLDKVRIGFLVSLIPFSSVLSLLLVRLVARAGYKRTFVFFYLARKLIISLLLFAPLVLERRGLDAAFAWVVGVVVLFSIFRAIAFSAMQPWQQELVPAVSRGKITAIRGVVSTLAQIAATAFAGWLIGRLTGLTPFLVLIGIGILAGIASGLCYARLPGGAPVPRKSAAKDTTDIRVPLRDRNYLLFLGGLALVTIGFSSANSFMPLFMMEAVGLLREQVVYLGISSLLAALIFYYAWGWAADRYGSKPVMLSGAGLKVLLPLAWIMLPLAGAAANRAALGVAFLAGVANTGWMIGYTRYLYVSAVPPGRRGSYLAVFMALEGISGGTGPLLAGHLLDRVTVPAMLPTHALVNPYLFLFLASGLLIILSLAFILKLRGDGAMPTRRFLGMFIQGNPFMAFESLVRYGFDQDEPARVTTTERIGRARNPLTVNELTESLRDPSFNVRYEALISASRMPASPELIDRLLTVLGGADPDLAGVAAWSLGRIGDPVTILPLREMLFSSRYPLLRARCARALGMIGDRGAVPALELMLRREEDPFLRVAVASALGSLKAKGATDLVLDVLVATRGEMFRHEVAFALVRIAGREGVYIRVLRRFHQDPGTTMAQVLYHLRRPVENGPVPDKGRQETADRAAEAFSAGRVEEGARLSGVLFAGLAGAVADPARARIVAECARRLQAPGEPRLEYFLLAQHLLLLRKKRRGRVSLTGRPAP